MYGRIQAGTSYKQIISFPRSFKYVPIVVLGKQGIGDAGYAKQNSFVMHEYIDIYMESITTNNFILKTKDPGITPSEVLHYVNWFAIGV